VEFWEAEACYLAWRCVSGKSCAGALLVYLRLNITRDDAQIEAGPEWKILRERRESGLSRFIATALRRLGGIVWLSSGSSLERVRLLITKSS